MNMKKLLDMQKELDKEILEKANIDEYPMQNIKLALIVELGELANEWQGFKHWKKNKVINREKLLEEWSDCFHFALSLENQLHQVDPMIIRNIDEIIRFIDVTATNKNILEAFEISFGGVINIRDDSSILLNTIALGRCLDIRLDEMEQAYLDKNSINHKRQASGY